MKKTTLLQSDLSYVIATLGHLDTLVIAESELLIPAETMRIDLALAQWCEPANFQTTHLEAAASWNQIIVFDHVS